MIQFHFRTMKAKGNPVLVFDQQLTLHSVWEDRTDVITGSEIHCQVEAQHIGEMVTVKGTLKARPTLRCARCLSDFEHNMNVNVMELFFEPSDVMQIEEDENIHAIRDDLVVLDPYFAENVSIAIPNVPLCSNQCKGLCPECGVNRNETECTCTSERLNPKFAALAKLLQSDSTH